MKYKEKDILFWADFGTLRIYEVEVKGTMKNLYFIGNKVFQVLVPEDRLFATEYEAETFLAEKKQEHFKRMALNE